MKQRVINLALAVILPLAIVALWEWQSRQGSGHAYAFAPLADIGRSFMDMAGGGSLATHAGASLFRALGALAIGGSLGVAVGLLMGLSRPFEAGAAPLLNCLRQVPILGWLPLVALWFGNGDGAKLLLVSLAAFYPMALNTQKGMHAIDAKHAEVARLYAMSRWQFLRFVAWPSALPLIFTGLAQALAFSWVATIGVELLFSASAGLGTEMVAAQVAARTDIVIVCIVCIGVMGFLLNQLFARICARLLAWQQPART